MGSAACANKGTSFRLAATDEIGGLSVTTLSHEKGNQVDVNIKKEKRQCGKIIGKVPTEDSIRLECPNWSIYSAIKYKYLRLMGNKSQRQSANTKIVYDCIAFAIFQQSNISI